MTNKTINDGIERMRRFRKIVLEHPRLGDIRKKIRWMLDDTKSVVDDNEAERIAARGRPIKFEEMWLLPIIGPSGAMKSTSIRKVLQEINADEAFPADDIPVLFVTMREVKNTRAFLGVVLEQYGDAAKDVIPKSGPIDAQLVSRAIYHIARRKRTVLLIIDEAHEMLRHDGGKVGKSMAMLIKSMLNEGVFSIVMLGTDEVLNLFHISKELKNRCVPEERVTLEAFDIKSAKDRVYFFKFLKRLEDEMVAAGVVDHALGWVDTLEDRAKVYDMCEGVLGVACRVLRMALERAFRDGRGSLEWSDIESAFRAFNRNQTKPGFDPFAEGPNKSTLGRLKAEAEAKNKRGGKEAA
ncbi:ATP-binding protein [Bradyrhizobium sp. NBAIM20]|uniref:ATP-binding protein n=1 Tax=unclassified Bradyrhizobium TaxID=2631580 RepID=UPI001CD3EA2F|nr:MULTISPECIES: ATP-binding protein [unclassified Bradyrhizobium]MCA1411709.1 ATP-binding protein [Bradyrhizobium sp. NBAIM20]MCA1460956.1 ATP-binding protein [Bradyrhizobium sp. NBAIM18]